MNTALLKRPRITEKSLKLASESNEYTFEVAREAHKNQIKAAIEQTFGVTVEKVNTVMISRDVKPTGRKRIKTVVAPRKKAMVRLKKGDTIKLFEFGGQEAE